MTTKELESAFSNLEFENDTHTYSVSGRILTPTSNMIKKFYKEFDSKRIAHNIQLGTGVPAEETLANWKTIGEDAANFGTKVHDFGEVYAYQRFIENREIQNCVLPSNGYEKSVVSYWDNLPKHIIPVSLELKMYSLRMGYAGTADIILLNTITNKLIIADYKTNKNLFKNFNSQVLLNPFSKLLDMPYNKYAIQLSYYQLLLEEKGFVVEDRVLVHLLEDGYKLYQTKDYTTELKLAS